LKELDEIVQEFSRQKHYTENREWNYHSKQYTRRERVDNSQLNKVLMAVVDDHTKKVSQKGSLTEKDIP
jgi:hypothetical protein